LLQKSIIISRDGNGAGGYRAVLRLRGAVRDIGKLERSMPNSKRG